MSDGPYAIMVQQDDRGWAWEVVDSEGTTVRAGRHPSRTRAIRTAYVAIRLQATANPDGGSDGEALPARG